MTDKKQMLMETIRDDYELELMAEAEALDDEDR